MKILTFIILSPYTYVFGITNFQTVQIILCLPLLLLASLGACRSPAIALLCNTLLLSSESHAQGHATEASLYATPLFPSVTHAGEHADHAPP